MTTITLTDKYGGKYDVCLHPIEGTEDLNIMAYDTGTLVIVKQTSQAFEVLELVEARVPIRHYFAAWHLPPNSDGTEQHEARRAGATHFGVISSIGEMHPGARFDALKATYPQTIRA